MSDTFKRIINRIAEVGGVPLAVGGSVRDELMGLPPKDLDVEVHGVTASTLISILQEFGKVDTVGASFGVIKLWLPDGLDMDFSLPRRESKNGTGHKGFIVEVDEALTIAEAAARRDFTMNSMARNLLTGELIDLFGGVLDVGARVLVHTSSAFADDPLRVLRGMQFAGRFNMRVANVTAELCNQLKCEFSTLAKERIWGEWEKWASKSVKPSMGLSFLVDTGWHVLFPELKALDGCPQDPVWHPEGDVWMHTLHVVDAAAEIADRDNLDRLVVVFGALCHDMGKPATTELKGRWVSPGHAAVGEEPTRAFMTSIGAPHDLIEKVVECVREHMVHIDFNGSKSTVRRFINRLHHASVPEVMAVIEADHSGRPPLAVGMPESARRMAEMAATMGNEVKPIMMGRHLIQMGVKPGVTMGNILKSAFEAQLDGRFKTVIGGKRWVRKVWQI